MSGFMRRLVFRQSRSSARSRPVRARRVIQAEELEGKTLPASMNPMINSLAEIGRPAAIVDNPLNQLCFLIGRWNAQVKFPNGAAKPQRQILNYRFTPHRSAILLQEVVFTRPRTYVTGVIAVDPANGQIVESGHDSSGYSVVQVWTPTVRGSFILTDVKENPPQKFAVSTTLSQFGPNAYNYARVVVFPDGATEVEALAQQHRAK
jgi:hypothetical protein